MAALQAEGAEMQACAEAAAERSRALEDEVEVLTLAKEGLEGQLAAARESEAALQDRLGQEIAELQADRTRLEAELGRASGAIQAANELKVRARLRLSAKAGAPVGRDPFRAGFRCRL